MYILTLQNNPDEGAFSIQTETGNNSILIFEEHDDAERYILMLDELEYPSMAVTEVDDDLMLAACEQYNYEYVIITPNELIIPQEYDKVYQNKI